MLETPGTSASHPMTIEPWPALTDPILDGGHSNTILTVDGLENEIFAYLNVTGLTFQMGAEISAGALPTAVEGR